MGLKVNIDLKLAQEIIDEVEKEKEWNSLSPFLQRVCFLYNQKKDVSIDWQNYRLRCEQGLLKTNIKKGKVKNKNISSEQKTKMFEARQKPNKKDFKNLSEANKLAIEQLQLNMGKKFPNLVKKGIEGSKSSLIKLHCLECVSAPDKGYIETIRNCQVFRCPLYIVRPFQKENEQDDDL